MYINYNYNLHDYVIKIKTTHKRLQFVRQYKNI